MGNGSFFEPEPEENLASVQEMSKADVAVQVNFAELIVEKSDLSVQEISKVDVAIQIQSDFLVPQFITFITNDQELSTMTGLCSFKLLDSIENLVKKVQTSNKSIKLNTRELIIMTLMKLKQNSTYAALAILFKFKNSDTCKKRIFEMLDILNVCLKIAIVWPSKENVSRNIPKCFNGFENVRVVVDCTEIKLQSPSNLCCQIQAYSHYKKTYTMKFMTGVTPAGLISFVSKPYGGRASDNMIFEQSGILSKLEKNDVVMADKGFTMESICRKNDVTLLTPFFCGKKINFLKPKQLQIAILPEHEYTWSEQIND